MSRRAVTCWGFITDMQSVLDLSKAMKRMSVYEMEDWICRVLLSYFMAL